MGTQNRPKMSPNCPKLSPNCPKMSPGAPPVLGVHLRLKLTNASLHLGHRLLAALQGVLLSLINPVLGVLDLSLQKLLVPLKVHRKLLLLPELISQPGGIHHGTLGLVLGHAGLSDHLVQVVAHGAHLPH